MGTSYEQFLACLRNSTARRLLGFEMTDEEAAVLAADGDAAHAYYEVWSASRVDTSAASTRTIPQTAPSAPIERALLDISTVGRGGEPAKRSEEHTSELPSLMRISSAVFCLKKKKN